jgi:hypothetical protein
MPSLDDLPAELVLQIIMATRSVRAVACFGATSRFCHALATDDLLWRAFYLDRFGVPSEHLHLLQTGRTWKWLYRACVPATNLAGAAVGTINTDDGTYSGDLLDGRPHGRGMAISLHGGLFDRPAWRRRPCDVPLKAPFWCFFVGRRGLSFFGRVCARLPTTARFFWPALESYQWMAPSIFRIPGLHQ